MNIGNKLISNSVFLFLDWIAVTALSLTFWLIIGKTLPAESYGILAASVSIITILSGASLLGLQTAVFKLISEYKERNRMGKISNLVRFSIKVGLSVSLGISVSLALLSTILSPILNLPVDAILVTSAGVFIFSTWGLTTTIMYGFQNMKRVMKTNFIGNVVKVAVSLPLILLGFSYFGPLTGLLLSIVAIILLRIDTLLLARKKFEDSGSKSSGLDKKSIFTYSLSAFITAMAMLGFANTPNIFLNALAGPAITGLFAISLTITSPILSIPSVLNSALFPITSALSSEKGGKERNRVLVNMILRYASFITLPLISVLLVFSGTIILLFSSSDYLPAVELLPIIGAGAFLFGIAGILSNTIYAMKKPAVSRNITILALAVFLVLAFPLTMWFSAVGMAFAYLASVFVFCSASMLYLNKLIKMSIEWMSMLKVVVGVFIFTAIIFGMDAVIEDKMVKIVGVGFSLMLYLLVMIPLRFYKREDLRILEFMSTKSPVGKRIFSGIRTFLSKYV